MFNKNYHFKSNPFTQEFESKLQQTVTQFFSHIYAFSLCLCVTDTFFDVQYYLTEAVCFQSMSTFSDR